MMQGNNLKVQHQLRDMQVNNIFQHVAFYYGLPESGKSTKLESIQKYDHNQDLLLNFRGTQTIDHIFYTHNYLRIQTMNGNKHFPAYAIPRYSRFAWNRSLRLYAYDHPIVPRILIDECQTLSVQTLVDLLTDICNIFQHTDIGAFKSNKSIALSQGHSRPDPYIVLAGVVYDAYNREYVTSKYLLHQPACHCVHAKDKCKYCNRSAQYMLSTYKGRKVTYSQLDKLPNGKGQKIKQYMYDHHSRYHVCPYHYSHPPMPVIKNPLIEL